MKSWALQVKDPALLGRWDDTVSLLQSLIRHLFDTHKAQTTSAGQTDPMPEPTLSAC